MIALLPMYDWPELASAHDSFWAAVRDNLHGAGIDAPRDLSRCGDLWAAWNDPDLVLGQTCSLPFRSNLFDHVNLVGALDYQVPNAPAGYYYSQLIVRDSAPANLGDYAGRTLAFNGHDSQSGWAAPQFFAMKYGISFAATLHTGSHCNSAQAVADGQADIAAIDAITWRMICRYLPDTANNLRVLGHTPPTPGLPLITAQPAQPVANAVRTAIANLPRDIRDILGFQALVDIPVADYLSMPIPATPTQVASQIP